MERFISFRHLHPTRIDHHEQLQSALFFNDLIKYLIGD